MWAIFSHDPEQEFTNYHFDCKPDALYGALQRFSQFFVAPLCKADALEREVNAVDNEFSGVVVQLLIKQLEVCTVSFMR